MLPLNQRRSVAGVKFLPAVVITPVFIRINLAGMINIHPERTVVFKIVIIRKTTGIRLVMLFGFSNNIVKSCFAEHTGISVSAIRSRTCNVQILIAIDVECVIDIQFG